MGAWISPDGRIHSTGPHGHFAFIVGRAAEFGLKPEEVRGLGVKDHQPTIDHALARGWVRVMGTRPNLGIQFAVLDGNTIVAVKSFLQKAKVDLSEKILFEESASGRSWYEAAAWIMTDEAAKFARNVRKKSRTALWKRSVT